MCLFKNNNVTYTLTAYLQCNVEVHRDNVGTWMGHIKLLSEVLEVGKAGRKRVWKDPG